VELQRRTDGALVVHAASLNPQSKGAHYLVDE
jgi:hypothetical protein